MYLFFALFYTYVYLSYTYIYIWTFCEKVFKKNNNKSVYYLGHIFGRTRTQWVILFQNINLNIQ